MRVLVARPEREARETAKRLEARGHVAILAPVTRVVGTNAAPPAEDFESVLATSAQAFHFASASLIERLRATAGSVDVVGEKTGGAVRDLGLPLRGVFADAAALAKALLAGPPAARLYLAGRDRKPTLEDALRAAGHRVEAIVVYEARAAEALPDAAIDALRAGEIDAVLHYSRRSAELLLERTRAAKVGDAFARARHACLSRDVAAPLEAAGLVTSIAATPDQDALFTALESV